MIYYRSRNASVATESVGVLLGEESSMRLLYSGLNGSGCDLNSRIHGCPVEDFENPSTHVIVSGVGPRPSGPSDWSTRFDTGDSLVRCSANPLRLESTERFGV